MASNLVQAIFEADSGLPEDRIINAWSFTTAASKDDSEAESIDDALIAFYGDIADLLSVWLSGSVTFKFYDRADATPRVPWFTETRVITGISASTLPHEVALCLSFAAAPVSGQPPARRRGRVFLGPLSQGAASASTGRPAAGVISSIVLAAQDLLDASTGASWSWSIYSTVDDATREVLSGWVDDAFDTQRRRGVAPVGRTTFSS